MDIWFIAEVDIAVVVLCSVPKSCPALLDPMNWAHQASLSLTVSLSLLRLMSIESECHPNISSSVASFPSCPQSFPASESFPMSQFFAKYWSFIISPSNEYSWSISFRIDWFDLLAVQGTPTVFFGTTVQKHQFFGAQPSLWSNSHIHTWLLEKP